jgi:hypothetical protein
MKRMLSTVVLAVSVVALSATVVLAAPPTGATGHGAQVSAAVATVVATLSGKARGAAISALAKGHGAVVSAAAKVKGAAASAAGKAKGAAAAAAGKAKGAAASEPGRLKGAAAAAAGQAHQP